MKKKSASRSAFFNVRVLTGVFILLAGILLALAGLGTFSSITANSAQAQPKHKIINIRGLPPGFDCATIYERHIDRMEGLKWGLLMLNCGEGRGGTPSTAFSPAYPKTAATTHGTPDIRRRGHQPDYRH
jgi:hypothetical protein